MPATAERTAKVRQQQHRRRGCRDADGHLTRHSSESGNLGPQGFQPPPLDPRFRGGDDNPCAHLPIYGLEGSGLCAAWRGRRPRQMRGTATAQIPDARISVCHGVGGMFAASATIIMASEEH
jgi:hypothetical protein